MPRKTDPAAQKTRPDLADREWIIWLEQQPENRGIEVRALYRKMCEWCQRRGVTPTRRRLLRWLDGEREAVPMIAAPPAIPEKNIRPTRPDCDYCGNNRFVRAEIDPNAAFEWARFGMVPCPKC